MCNFAIFSTTVSAREVDLVVEVSVVSDERILIPVVQSDDVEVAR